MDANSTLGKQFHNLSPLKCRTSKHAGSDPEVFWLRPVMAVTASAPPESARILYARSDFPHPFQLRFFRRKPGSYCAKPTMIRSGRPGQGLAKHIWSGSKPGYRNHRAGFLAGRNRPATSFPLSDPVPFFHRRPG